mgnify:CR=1 FL=1|tara:strand:- start:571 stop:1494 length:924 start_codon:yes stop_codon:yes gene_type:complete
MSRDNLKDLEIEEYETKNNLKIYPVLNDSNKLINKEIIQEILKIGNIKEEISDLDIYQRSLIHKSYIYDNDFVKNEKYFGNIDALKEEDNPHILPLQKISNEVLEWLGDGIIQAVSASYLHNRFNDQKEGFLTKIRSRLVRTATLSKFALALGLDKYLIISKHVEIICCGRDNAKILEDSFEAFIGAMMIDFGRKGEDYGFKIIHKFLISLIENKVDITSLIINDDNYKDQLMRYFQKRYNGKYPIYEQTSIENITNNNGIVNKRFNMCVRDDNNNIIGEGSAKSKKEAEQKAAKNALMYFGIFSGY